ncbi:MAG: hypothetical protein HN413_03225 [Chloroflexi bacterium]|nr:hypothetical protein [Chloroflexota bacterium]
MTLAPELKQLINAYLDEVGLNLPKKKRTDITTEIRSLILDDLENRAQDQTPDEALLLDVLKELGPPVQMAASYAPHNFVIGPSVYGSFWLSVRVVLIIQAVIYLIGFGFAIGNGVQSPLDLLTTLGAQLADYGVSALQAFTVIVLVYMVFERVIPDQDWVAQLKARSRLSQIPFFRSLLGLSSEATTAAWDPATLVTIPESERVKRGSLIFEMGFIALVMILFNFFPHKVGVYGFMSGEGSWFLPLLTPAFGTYLLWWNLYWILTLGLNFVLLAAARWTRFSRWLELGLMIFSGIIVYAMLTGAPVLGLNPEYVLLNNTSAAGIRLAEETLLPILTILFNLGLSLHLIAKVVRIAIKFYRLLFKS